MTTRLYYNSPKLREFIAKILASEETSDGYLLCLDRTAFYPTSGGQPHDTGTINRIPVTNVWDDDFGKIWHLLPTLPDSDQVYGQIDWARRFDHMQQHSGQHILSSVFIEVLSANTISFQIGKEASTIDIDISSLTTEAIREVETTANTIAWANHPIAIQTISDENIGSIPLRKPPQVAGEIRVIWIETIDASACGGTHVESTGEIGLIKIKGTERYKGNIRVTFTCGGRALRDYQRIHHIVQNVSANMSIHIEDLSEAITRIKEDNTKIQSALKQTKKELMTLIADQLWNETTMRKGQKRIGVYLQNRQYDEILIIANRLRENPNTIILLAAPDDEKVRLVCTRSNSLKEIDAGKIIRYAVSLLNGKGGGPPEMAHGGIPINDRDIINEAIQKTIDSI